MNISEKVTRMDDKKIYLSFEIRLSDEEFSNSIIYFNKWIPNRDNSIVVSDENLNLSIWIDEDCVERLSDKDILSWINISVNKIKAEIIFSDISDELVKFIYDERDNSKMIHYGISPENDNEKYNELNKTYIELGNKALKLTYDTCNKVISFARNEKGQFHLEQLTYNREMLRSLYIELGAKCKINDGEWFRWSPSPIDKITITMGNDEEYIRYEDWENIKTFIDSSARTSLVNELLSNAMSLVFKYGHRRNAVIEASTALEVALSDFSETPNFEKLGSLTDIGRIKTSNLKNQVNHLGFSGSMSYLIPVIFNEEIFPTDTLNQCQKAIEARNNIVHQGQRDIKDEVAKKHVLALKKACEILKEYTK